MTRHLASTPASAPPLQPAQVAATANCSPACPGTTVTAVIVVGYLLTVANIGDSSAVLDTGCSILELTGSHRIQSNPEEQARLRSAGCQLAPLGFHLQGPARQGELGVGPLRLWPGGLCVSRSVGDLDAGPEVVPLPHIRQVRLAPRAPGRERAAWLVRQQEGGEGKPGAGLRGRVPTGEGAERCAVLMQAR